MSIWNLREVSKQSAEALLDSALKSAEPRDLGYPVLFAYRRSLELYLKIVGEIQEPTHSLKMSSSFLVEKHHRRANRLAGTGVDY